MSPPSAGRAHSVVTFYSYKGGVGRSMALANVAALLASWGRKVLVLDFDLEAPGLDRYFDQPHLFSPDATTADRVTGLVDLMIAVREGRRADWRDHLIHYEGRNLAEPLHLLAAGARSTDYASKVQTLNWDQLFAEHGLGEKLATMRQEWCEEYDIVLVDSRTGMSDIGGICTIILPDALVMLFTANSQSIDGTVEVARLARRAQEDLPVERARLLTVPMLSRDDRGSEYEQSERWRGIIAEKMRPFFDDWVNRGVSAEMVLQKLYLPQVAFWSFGERLPVLEKPQELEDPRALGAAYLQLAQLIDADFAWSAVGATPPPAPLAASAEPPTVRAAPPEEVQAVAVERNRSRWLLPAIVGGLAALFLATIIWAGFGRQVVSPDPTPSSAPAAAIDTATAQATLASTTATPEERLAALAALTTAGAVPQGARLDGLVLSGRIRRLPGCVDCTMNGADLRGVALDNGFFSGTSMAKANMQGASAIGATLQDVDLSGSDLTDVSFDGAKLLKVRIGAARIAPGQLSTAQRKETTGTPNVAGTQSQGDATSPVPTTADQVVGGDTADGWDVDVFWCEGRAGAESYAAARRAAATAVGLSTGGRTLAPGVRLGRVRLRVLSAKSQASGLFFRGRSNHVVEDGLPGEAEAAKALAAELSRGGAAYHVRTNLATKTKWYLSAFACG